MRSLAVTLILAFLYPVIQTSDIAQVRRLYAAAPLSKPDAQLLDKLMLQVDTGSGALLYCYKGANEMIQAKYAINPMVKLDKFGRGKNWITAAINRDTSDLEMRFIRFSIQQNLPAFLGYREDVSRDKRFLLANIKACPDQELKKMIMAYLTSAGVLTPAEMKGMKN